MIAGSHDYSVSGKTFLDVLEKGGFCEICKYGQYNEVKQLSLVFKLKLIYTAINLEWHFKISSFHIR